MSLADEVASTTWYHTLELPGGVVTPGWFDLRSVVERVPVPASLAGKRCLDVGTCDGFWAFHMERRGADEVIGVDLDDPARRDWQGPPPADPEEHRKDSGRAIKSFGIAKAAYDSKVERIDCNVYDLTPDIVGTFDFVFIGSLLLHLRDPIGALMAIRRVVKPDGQLLSFDAVSLRLTVTHPVSPAGELWDNGFTSWWWTPNMAAYRHYFPAAGYDLIKSGGPFRQRFGPGHPYAQPKRRSMRRQAQVVALNELGTPSAWALATPTKV